MRANPALIIKNAVAAAGILQKTTRPWVAPNGRVAAKSKGARLLFGQLKLGDGELFLAVHFFDRSGGSHFFGFVAQVFVERFARIIINDVIGYFLAVLGGLDGVLALLGFMQGAFGAVAISRDGYGFFLSRRGGERQAGEGDGGGDDG